MAIPLPQVVADVGPGGPLVTSMRGINALRSDMLANKIKAIEAQYAPITAQANAASKLAYSNLMGPQFMAKLMGNENLLANLPDDQKQAALQSIYQAANGNNNGLNMLNKLPQQEPSMMNQIGNKIKGWFGGGGSQAQPTNALSSNQQAQQMPQQTPQQAPQQAQQSYDPQLNRGGQGYNESLRPSAQAPQVAPQQKPTFAENVGAYKGVVGEATESGKIRAQHEKEFADQYEGALTREDSYNQLTNIATSPTFQEMRRSIPFFQDKQLKVLSKIGTPQQQQMIGDFITTSQELVKDTVNSFKGARLAGELGVAQSMKISPDDTINVMLGKLEAGATYNQFAKQRASIASDLMTNQHMNKKQALEKADKMMDGRNIRNDIHNRLNPTVTIKNPSTGEIITISIEEARRRGVKNV